MIICAPKILPMVHGDGSLAIRVIEPETPVERELAKSIDHHLAIWRVTFWRDGRVWMTTMTGAEPPSLSRCQFDFSSFPKEWVEMIRMKL